MTMRLTPPGRRSALLAIAGVLLARGALATPDGTREWLAGLARARPRTAR
jgi:hypothetical protein